MSQLMRLEMPDGQQMWATVDAVDGPGDSGLGDRVAEKLHGFEESLRTVATNVRNSVAAARPDEVSIEFGLELALGAHGVVAALVGGGGTAAFKVTLTWQDAGRPVPPIPPQPPAAGPHPPDAPPAPIPAQP